MPESSSRPRPRFQIKIARWATASPVILRDRSRPAFRGHYRTLEAACRAMDNIVRRERGVGEAHYGQHVQGCISCYAFVEAQTPVIPLVSFYEAWAPAVARDGKITEAQA